MSRHSLDYGDSFSLWPAYPPSSPHPGLTFHFGWSLKLPSISPLTPLFFYSPSITREGVRGWVVIKPKKALPILARLKRYAIIIQLLFRGEVKIARIVSGKTNPEDTTLDTSLRPKSLDDFIGQNKVKENLSIAIAAAKGRGEPLDHMLLYGPAGLGKTTLAYIIAAEMQVNIKITSGPAIERSGDLAAILTNLRSQDILFIDEIHRLNRTVEEVLYPAMEDFALDLVIGKGAGAKSLRLNLPAFTLIGATTRFAMLSSPLRDRFGSIYHLDFYDQTSIETILKRSARILGIKAEAGGLAEIARRARGTPRVANRLLKRVRDYAQVQADNIATHSVAVEALSKLEIDPTGLDDTDRKVLHTIIEKFNGGPVGLETIAAAISEEADTIMDVYEPYLLQLGFLDRTPRGRVATPLAYQHLGLPYDKEKPPQPTLL
ncbi:MAG: Holliday junction branch migration DNA helicase RuvB [Chloroflexi bacterium]|nr:Holliday junction branch migration DNA helicase RuvB [Chloroflexota bacterium]